MKAPPFAYARAYSLDEVFRLQAGADGLAVVLAGGQSLLASLAFRLSAPSLLIDITAVPELKGVTRTETGAIRVGALTTHAALGSDATIRHHVPLLTEAVPLIAHPAIRNRGTLGGSLAYADPAAELPACCVALGATIVTAATGGGRRIPAAEFYTGLFETALKEGEIIAAVEFPPCQVGDFSTIIEIARRSGDYAMAGLAARMSFLNGRIANPKLVFFGVGPAPVEAKAAASSLAGQPLSAATLAAAQSALDADLDPPGDLNGGPDMKRHLARVLLARAMAKHNSTRANAA